MHVYRKLVLEKSFENWKKLAEHYFSINKAHLLMLYKTAIVPKHVAKMIGKALENLEIQDLRLTEDVEDMIFLIEKILGEKISPEIAGYLHVARSRNDVDATIFRMVVRERLIQLINELTNFLEILIEIMSQNLETYLLLYTHGQPAQVSTLAHFLAAIFEDVYESLEILFWSYKSVNHCPMGAAAITTTGFGIDREMVAEYLGFERPLQNSYRAIVTHNWLFFPSISIQAILLTLSRLLADLSHKSSSEVGIIDFPDDLIQISSIMPQKRNPVILEHARIRVNKSLELLNSVARIFSNIPYQDVNEIGDEILFTFLGTMETVHEAIELFKEIVRKMRINVSRVKQIALKMGATTTELADELVRKYEIDFRTSHRKVSDCVKKGMDYEVFIQLLSETFGEKSSMSKEEFFDILSVEHFVKVRRTYGGPSKQTMKEALKNYRKNLLAAKRKIKGFQEKLLESKAKLDNEFQQMLYT